MSIEKANKSETLHHEHKHHHGDGCDCGHEHQHEDDCDCGHEHPHEYDCNCRHEHHHEESMQRHARGKQKIYILENLGCAHCASKMEARIRSLDGIEDATITYATKQLRITAKHPEKYLQEIETICNSIEDGIVIHEQEHASHSDDQKTGRSGFLGSDAFDLSQIIIGALLFIAGVVLERVEAVSFVTPVIFIIAYLILGIGILLTAAKNILKGNVFDENFLMSIATLGALFIQEYPEAVGVMLFYRIGEFFEHKAVERSRMQIMNAIDMRPEVVYRLRDGKTEKISASDAKVGDILSIRPGDRIPLDGVVIEGESRIDTSPITGEPVPVAVKKGEAVISGCVNASGALTIKVEHILEESMVTRILNSVENAAAGKPKIDRFITRFAHYYTPCVVFAALLVAIVPSLIAGGWNYWIYTALTFLVMSCPCALVLSVPLAFFSGIGTGSRKGILFKGGLSIEALNNVKAIVMDKTGTLTKGCFSLQKIITLDNAYSKEALLRICASCEQKSTHPIAQSITAAANEQRLTLSVPSSLEEISGHGVKAVLPEGIVLCGNAKLMETYGVSTDAFEQNAFGSQIFLAINNKPAGCFIISDEIKPDAKEAISRLKSKGLRTIMLTGDSERSAKAVANEIGVEEVYAKLLPQDKLSILKDIRQKHGSVMFIGDGINDAPVLAGADVGAAMGSGADAAIEAADAVFMNAKAEAIPESIEIAKRTNRIAMQNVVFALIIKFFVMALGLIGHANMWMAVFADTGVAMLCVLNSLRALYKK